MDHRLSSWPANGQPPFHLYYPFISPASYLPAITGSPQRSIESKSTELATSPPQQPQV